MFKLYTSRVWRLIFAFVVLFFVLCQLFGFTPESQVQENAVLRLNTTSSDDLFAVATMASPTYCRPTLVLYRSFRQLLPPANICFVVMMPHPLSVSTMAKDSSCVAIFNDSLNFCIRFVSVPKQKLPSGSNIDNIRWRYSSNKLSVFNLEEYKRVLFVDADTILVSSFVLQDYLFAHTETIVAAVDQSDGCKRREVLNAGIFSFTPSKQLFRTLQDAFEGHSCLSGTWRWSDQELLNCVCGTAGSKQPPLRGVTCRMLSYNYGANPDVVSCPEYKTQDVKAIHFAGDHKPWHSTRLDFHVHPFKQLWLCFDRYHEHERGHCVLNA